MDALQSQDLRGLTPQALEALAQRMLVHVQQQAREIARRDGEIVWRDAKIEKITFELARLKRMYADLALENTAINDVLSRKL